MTHNSMKFVGGGQNGFEFWILLLLLIVIVNTNHSLLYSIKSNDGYIIKHGRHIGRISHALNVGKPNKHEIFFH